MVLVNSKRTAPHRTFSEPVQLLPRLSCRPMLLSKNWTSESWRSVLIRRELPGASRGVARRDATSTTNPKRSPPPHQGGPLRITEGRKELLPLFCSVDFARCPGLSVTCNGSAPRPVTQSSYETMSNVTNANLVDRRARCLPSQFARDASLRHSFRSASSFEPHFNPERRPRASSGIDRPPPPLPDELASAIPRRRRQDPTPCQTRIPVRQGIPPPTTRC